MEPILIWSIVTIFIAICLCAYLIQLCRTPNKEEKYVSWLGLDFISRIGFEFISIPSADFLQLKDSCIVDNYIAQLRFLVPSNNTMVFRSAINTGRDISRKIHLSYSSIHHFTVGDIPVTLYYNHSGPELALWKKGKFRYSIFLENSERGLMGALIELFVKDANCRLNR